MSFFKKKKEEYVNDLINIADVKDSILYTKDNYIMGYINVEPINISLLSKAEQKRKRTMLVEKFNDEDTFEFFKISKSVDFSKQLNYLQELASNCDNSIKKMGLKESYRSVSRYCQSGEMVENQYYYIFREKYTNEDYHIIKDFKDKLNDFVNKLADCEIKAYILTDQEIIQLNNLFCNPIGFHDDFEINEYQNIAVMLDE